MMMDFPPDTGAERRSADDRRHACRAHSSQREGAACPFGQIARALLEDTDLPFRHRIRGALACLGRFVDAEQVFFWSLDPTAVGLHDAIVWPKTLAGDSQWQHLPDIQAAPYLLERLQARPETIAAMLRGQDDRYREYLLWPVANRARLVAILGFAKAQNCGSWPQATRDLLQIAGPLFQIEWSRHLAERDKRRSELRYRVLASHLPNSLILLFDHDFRHLVAEGEAHLCDRLSASRIEGRTMRDIFSESECRLLEPLYRRVLAGETVTQELAFGSEIFEVRFVPVRRVDGSVSSGMAVLQNITERKCIENELRQTQQALQDHHEQETVLAAEIQRTLLQGTSVIRNRFIDLEIVSLPSMQVDGDFFDVFSGAEGVYELIFGDVMGKGIPAAMIGAATRLAFLRALQTLPKTDAASVQAGPERILKLINQDITDPLARLNSFITLLTAHLDAPRRLLKLVNCGHPPVIVYHLDGTLRLYASEYPPIGIMPPDSYACREVVLRPGDLIIMVSDGVTEARNTAGEFFGEQRLLELIRASAGQPAAQVLHTIRTTVFRFAGTRGLTDDFSCLVARIAGD